MFTKTKGFADICGEQAWKFSLMENTARKIFSLYGFEEIRIPIVEYTQLFQRSIGAETDVVQKEMFTFPDRKGRSLTLRPEATAGVLRACIEEGWARKGKLTRLYTIGPMFRYERPQKGRMRQFHQINCEFLGTDSPYADAGMICMLLGYLNRLRIPGLKLKLNSLGCSECRTAYLETLKNFLDALPEDNLCADCRRRKVSNPLRVLDCKQPGCKELTENAPTLFDHSCGSCRDHFSTVRRLLDDAHISYELDHRLVRGLDYYARTTFEVVSEQIGAQTAVAGGGRYDGLISQLGGEDIPGVGFACGMERLALLMETPSGPVPDFYLLVMSSDLFPRAFVLLEKLHASGFSGLMNYSVDNVRNILRHVSHAGIKFCLFLGPDELRDEEITLKNMITGEQRRLPLNNIAEDLASVLGRDSTTAVCQ